MSEPYRLYAITHSLYSGRARAYLIKQGIPFRELSTGHESFKAEVLPKGKLATIPTLVTPEGEVIRDGAAIIEHFESANDRPCRPLGSRQQIVECTVRCDWHRRATETGHALSLELPSRQPRFRALPLPALTA